MIRDAVADIAYWNEWIEFEKNLIVENIDIISRPSGNPSYRPQFVRDLAFMHLKLLLYRFSKGDAITDLPQYFEPFLHYWEESMRLGATVWTPEEQVRRHTWAINLDHYMDSFWLVGLALAFNIPDAQWQRLLVLIGNEGEDTLLDTLISSREPSRRIGTVLCYPTPYKKLQMAVEAPKAKQAELLNDFVENWYGDLAKAVKNGSQKQGYPITKPYWYNYHNPMQGAYFGYWCIEAVAAVKAFGLDDSLCLGHPHYPGDLLRPTQTTPADATRLPAALVASINAPPVPHMRPPEVLSYWQAFKMVVKNKFNS
jgi:hypothetical protein